MAKQIRSSVWETNSSSSHSISIEKYTKTTLELLYPDEEGVFYVGLRGETNFKDNFDSFNSSIDKINYAFLTALGLKEPYYEEMLIDVIKEHTGAKSVINFLYLDNWDWRHDEEDEPLSEIAVQGKLYIEGGEFLNDFFESREILYDFLFNKDYAILCEYN